MAVGGLLIRLVSPTGPGGPLDTPGGYETRKWFAANFVCRTPEAGELCLWERRR